MRPKLIESGSNGVPIKRALIVAVVASCLVPASDAAAETGMALVIDAKTNKARRIDLKDGKVTYTSPAFGTNVANGRFSVDGTRIVTISSSTGEVAIRDLDGKVLETFGTFLDTDESRVVSWANSGIWVGGVGRLALYDPATGDQKQLLTLKAG